MIFWDIIKSSWIKSISSFTGSLPLATSTATEGTSIWSSTSLYTSTSCREYESEFSSTKLRTFKGVERVILLTQTSSIWSFESSVKARRSCLRMPSSTKKRRAPSLIVSVRSNFLSTFQSLWICLYACTSNEYYWMT